MFFIFGGGYLPAYDRFPLPLPLYDVIGKITSARQDLNCRLLDGTT